MSKKTVGKIAAALAVIGTIGGMVLATIQAHKNDPQPEPVEDEPEDETEDEDEEDE